MQAIQADNVELTTAHHRSNERNVVRAAWPIHRGTGARSTATVLFELASGMHLGTHTDSAEEVLVVLQGEVDVVVGDERRRLAAHGMAVVPAGMPHDVIAAGPQPARVLGVFPSNTIVSVFDDEWAPFSTRVLGTPPPAELAA
jgi:quercetin dioxygenase-like cupin family protein